MCTHGNTAGTTPVTEDEDPFGILKLERALKDPNTPEEDKPYIESKLFSIIMTMAFACEDLESQAE